MSVDASVTKRNQPGSKRPGLPKVRTGCSTCKTRRIKCDEEKPSCKRCTLTGRVCDGYKINTKLSGSSTETSCRQLLGPKLLLPRRDQDKVRSYRFFLNIASPALSTLFDFDFWLKDIPRICHTDPAIWHAVVGLSAAYELYSRAIDNSTATAKLRQLIRTQTSESIRSLTNLSSRHSDKSRALVVSILFTCMSSIQWHYDEAHMHLKFARKILTELSYDRT
ncbi:Aspercryptin biosynthesis cluster-specific transcription regulator like protein [Verticillium longisporum]|nr:Aspercryptin biosynthesis cluster-specific transcription regulator like protein [Verticillium longisporum]